MLETSTDRLNKNSIMKRTFPNCSAFSAVSRTRSESRKRRSHHVFVTSVGLAFTPSSVTLDHFLGQRCATVDGQRLTDRPPMSIKCSKRMTNGPKCFQFAPPDVFVLYIRPRIASFRSVCDKENSPSCRDATQHWPTCSHVPRFNRSSCSAIHSASRFLPTSAPSADQSQCC